MPEDAPIEDARFESLVEGYLAWHYSQHPGRATRDGVHDYDDMLGSASRDEIEGRIESLYYHLKEVWRLDRPKLSPDHRIDAEILEAHLQAQLLELEQIRTWERDPGFYREIASDGLSTLVAFEFESAAARMRHATRRFQGVGPLLDEARQNLQSPSRIHVEVAIDQFTGLHKFVKDAMPRAFAPVLVPFFLPGGRAGEGHRVREWREFRAARLEALKRIEEFIDWMRKDLLPRADGPAAIGEHDFAQMLAFRELVRETPDAMLKDGYRMLLETQNRFDKLGGVAALRKLSEDRPTADTLLDRTRETLAAARDWAKTVVDVPDGTVLVQETPPYRRATSFASMELPGPFEARATEAYYSVTPPEPSWTEEEQVQHLSFYHRSALTLITVHEAYPGHYVQFLHAQKVPGGVRKAVRSTAFSEGWAHYCEQLYAERHPDIELTQLHLALMRICRYIVAIEFHCKGMSLEEAAAFFVKEGRLERKNAEREAKRAAVDPMVLAYTLGKREILKLRAASNLPAREFHARLLSRGAPPIGMIHAIHP